MTMPGTKLFPGTCVYIWRLRASAPAPSSRPQLLVLGPLLHHLAVLLEDGALDLAHAGRLAASRRLAARHVRVAVVELLLARHEGLLLCLVRRALARVEVADARSARSGAAAAAAAVHARRVWTCLRFLHVLRHHTCFFHEGTERSKSGKWSPSRRGDLFLLAITCVCRLH